MWSELVIEWGGGERGENGGGLPQAGETVRQLCGSKMSLICLGECYSLGQKACEGLVGNEAQYQAAVRLSRASNARLRIQIVSWREQSSQRELWHWHAVTTAGLQADWRRGDWRQGAWWRLVQLSG